MLKERMMLKKRNEKGFTLAELLIVVAIIAVLVAIAIPIFTSQLEKSRQATDLANLRSAYAEASVAALDSGSNTGSATSVKMVHTGTFDKVENPVLGKTNIKDWSVTKDQTVTVTVNADGTVSKGGE